MYNIIGVLFALKLSKEDRQAYLYGRRENLKSPCVKMGHYQKMPYFQTRTFSEKKCWDFNFSRVYCGDQTSCRDR